MKEFFGTGFILAIIALAIFWPFVVIWALNTVFALGIEYTFWTWLAVGVLSATLKANVKVNKG